MLILSFVAFSKYRPLYIIVVNSVWEDVSSQSDCTAAAFSEVRSTNYYVNPRMFFFKHTRSHISGRHELDSSHLLLPPPTHRSCYNVHCYYGENIRSSPNRSGRNPTCTARQTYAPPTPAARFICREWRPPAVHAH